MRAVIQRGRLMSSVRGSMAAILKLDLETVTALCNGTEAVVANHNAPTQIVISGPANAVREIVDQAEAAGGRGVPLNVSGPFHSPLMLSAQESLARVLKPLEFSAPTIPVVSGVSGSAVTEPETLKHLLVGQMTAIVHWVDVLSELGRLGIDTAVEVGSGDVLTRLGRRSDSTIRFLTFEEAMNGQL
jgi:[acyl-carrier-protein] S-malonyltransferase